MLSDMRKGFDKKGGKEGEKEEKHKTSSCPHEMVVLFLVSMGNVGVNKKALTLTRVDATDFKEKLGSFFKKI
jgi:hypothetical protein